MLIVLPHGIHAEFHKLTTTLGDEINFKISPNGNYIMTYTYEYTHYGEYCSPLYYKLRIININGKKTIALKDGYIIRCAKESIDYEEPYCEFSPDDKYIACREQKDINVYMLSNENLTKVFEIKGSTDQEYASDGSIPFPYFSWHPSGTYLAIAIQKPNLQPIDKSKKHFTSVRYSDQIDIYETQNFRKEYSLITSKPNLEGIQMLPNGAILAVFLEGERIKAYIFSKEKHIDLVEVDKFPLLEVFPRIKIIPDYEKDTIIIAQNRFDNWFHSDTTEGIIVAKNISTGKPEIDYFIRKGIPFKIPYLSDDRKKLYSGREGYIFSKEIRANYEENLNQMPLNLQFVTPNDRIFAVSNKGSIFYSSKEKVSSSLEYLRWNPVEIPLLSGDITYYQPSKDGRMVAFYDLDIGSNYNSLRIGIATIDNQDEKKDHFTLQSKVNKDSSLFFKRVNVSGYSDINIESPLSWFPNSKNIAFLYPSDNMELYYADDVKTSEGVYHYAGIRGEITAENASLYSERLPEVEDIAEYTNKAIYRLKKHSEISLLRKADYWYEVLATVDNKFTRGWVLSSFVKVKEPKSVFPNDYYRAGFIKEGAKICKGISIMPNICDLREEWKETEILKEKLPAAVIGEEGAYVRVITPKIVQGGSEGAYYGPLVVITPRAAFEEF